MSRKILRKLSIATLVIAAAGVLLVNVFGRGWLAPKLGPGTVTKTTIPVSVRKARDVLQARTVNKFISPDDKQILFGDLHVHSTYSFDAFMFALPMFQGEDAHPPADACDFARFSSALDFWSITDHAEGLTPAQWRETEETIRQCNAVGGDAQNPDTVAFLGWEWTQSGSSPENHYGHKNVILAEQEEGKVPDRPVAAMVYDSNGNTLRAFESPPLLTRAAGALFGGDIRYHELAQYLTLRAGTKPYPPGSSMTDLPENCSIEVATPGELFGCRAHRPRHRARSHGGRLARRGTV